MSADPPPAVDGVKGQGYGSIHKYPLPSQSDDDVHNIAACANCLSKLVVCTINLIS